ncbi:hypothetical protein [Rhabdaerophilum calidifontis]|uniref:hypothetical protein n=1 Tax=Rhabdaerophilum calidifontis TaxID=2604328 RepID=UPI0012392BE8|nr:hypothetical protein [Rhabdaerophilum calidifontis]
MRLRAAALLLGLWAVMPSHAAIAAGCEQITNAFAYNECLARQGPQRGQRAATAAGDPEATVRGRARGRAGGLEPLGGGHGVTIQRRGGNRVSATIDPWSSVRQTDSSLRRRRR